MRSLFPNAHDLVQQTARYDKIYSSLGIPGLSYGTSCPFPYATIFVNVFVDARRRRCIQHPACHLTR